MIEYPINGVLDLHTFHPRDVNELIPDYIDACLKKGITQIRIVHGKGTGSMRRMVHAILDESPFVIKYWHESGTGGSWGATIVRLKNQ